ncbi:hypothetical protein BN946_scf184895.g8 [Trametes cinnabarina]|uniref:Vacuolar membrane-associated protein IML1 n=1 Tax=Pycnoporus cinnabarinus TaxID=5643 RepID=A0A060SRZ5_PYCCI|nr:hypothetical protein BN946_scf184895.g8 [Trametes cinnabarina]
MSRAESLASAGRKRSNTVQSIFTSHVTSSVPSSSGPAPAPAPPLKVGDSRTLTAWVNDGPGGAVKLNHRHWPGVAEGDLICIASPLADHSPGFLFVVPEEDTSLKHQLQISLPRPVLEKFGLRNSGEVTLTKVEKEKFTADYVEFVFQDQYLGRNDMWRLGRDQVGQCLYVDQHVSFIGVIAAKAHSLYIGGKKVSAAYISPATKVLFRSLSAKVTILIQVCRELWEFAGDGERYNEKIVHSFLPALFAKWGEAATNHIVTIVLISRVYYDHSEMDYAAGPLRCDEEGRWYKDFFKVITDLEVLYDWKPTLVSLKDSFWAFQRDILLAHHYHRARLSSADGQHTPDHVRLVGQISYAHDGPLLEALNLALNPTETHYIDRSLSYTGSSTIVITPGTGYYRVSKQLLRLTTTRMLDQGFPLHLVSLAKPPLHQTPIFRFKGFEPEPRAEVGKFGPRALDPLWGGDDSSGDSVGSPRELKTFWWEPFWMTISFWDKQMDLPFRRDRFVARAKMHEIEMLGLLDHDVLSSIEIPYLPDPGRVELSSEESVSDMSELGLSTSDVLERRAVLISLEEADDFDMDVFTVREDLKPIPMTRSSLSSNGSAPTLSSSWRGSELKRSSTARTAEPSRISPIEESPKPHARPLPVSDTAMDREQRLSVAIAGGALSTSPSQSSILSARSNRSQRSSRSATTATLGSQSNRSTPRASGISKYAPTWLLNPFRAGISQPQTSPVSASGVTGPTPPLSPSPSTTSLTTTQTAVSRTSQAVTIKTTTSARPIGRRVEGDEHVVAHRGSFNRHSHSPVGTPPREDFLNKRRATLTSVSNLPILPVNLLVETLPWKPQPIVSYAQASLARRWQHAFPRPLTKHEIKWKAMVNPLCLPLTVEHFPSTHELETSYGVFSYDFVIDPPEMHSFLVKFPPVTGSADEVRRAWGHAVMRGMVALRLAQGFQFVLRPSKRTSDQEEAQSSLRRTKSYAGDDTASSRPIGAADVLRSPHDSVYLSMSNEIHHIMCSGDSIKVQRYVRRLPPTRPFDYQFLIWPKDGEGYTEWKTSFSSHGMENYGWNRLDMLVAGYENQFSESLRYWRTRFVVIPTDESPHMSVGPAGEKLNEEETRLLGMDKLAECFSKARWYAKDDTNPPPPVRLIPTDLGPAQCVQDESIIAQLDEIHAAGPLRKKVKSEKDISDMSLPAIAKAMREDDGVPIKEHSWHGRKYANSFTGTQFVTWLVREFRDISNREQATEWGAKLMEQVPKADFETRHYFYVLRGEYIVPMTPKASWFSRPSKHDDSTARGLNSPRTSSGKRPKKRLILSQSMIIDVDPKERSDQAESVVLHHDIIHNPATCFHFEFHWIGTTARCIEDLLQQWSRTIERYGLKLVEAYVDQISDVRDKNPFQSCFPIPLALPPPQVSDLQRRVPEGVQAHNYFESALLRKWGFVLDIEAASHYPSQIDVVYSYRRSPFKYSQWVHRSGVAFVQVLGGSQGFLFLINRLMAPGRVGTALKYQRPAAAAEDIRINLYRFCSDKEALARFYDEEIAHLEHTLEEPPPLHI